MNFKAKNHTCKIVNLFGWYEFTVVNSAGACVSSGYWESTEADCLKHVNAFLATLPNVLPSAEKKFSTLATYKKAENNGFKARFVYAMKKKSIKNLASVANDFAAVHFARYMVLDCFGTKRFCWTLVGAYAWLPFCSANAKIVDTLDFSTVAERTQKYA